jgi:hypothetical protein
VENLLSLLKSFNRQERFFLVGAALGNPEFRLGEDFRHDLARLFGLELPANLLVAMDYHLDWLHAAMVIGNGGAENVPHQNVEAGIQGSQEDVDLMIAFDCDYMTHVLLLEAKAETGWTNEQMSVKATRLAGIFGTNGTMYTSVCPHFALLSPKEPSKLKTGKWPVWMLKDGRPLWLELKVPKGLRLVERCDQSGRAHVEGGYFRVRQSET